MSQSMKVLEDHTRSDYKYGFSSEIETDVIPKGIDEDVVRQKSCSRECNGARG
jgi:Fe-S cluster assembly protein SufB